MTTIASISWNKRYMEIQLSVIMHLGAGGCSSGVILSGAIGVLAGRAARIGLAARRLRAALIANAGAAAVRQLVQQRAGAGTRNLRLRHITSPLRLLLCPGLPQVPMAPACGTPRQAVLRWGLHTRIHIPRLIMALQDMK